MYVCMYFLPLHLLNLHLRPSTHRWHPINCISSALSEHTFDLQDNCTHTPAGFTSLAAHAPHLHPSLCWQAGIQGKLLGFARLSSFLILPKPPVTVFWLIRGQAAWGFGWALCLGAGRKHGAVRSVRQIFCLGEIWSTLRSWCAPKAIGIIRKMQHHKR